MKLLRLLLAGLLVAAALGAPAAAQVYGARVPIYSGARDAYPGAAVALDFVGAKTGGTPFFKAGGVITSSFAAVPGVAVSRASTGYTYCAGQLTLFQAGQARIAPQGCGLLVELSRTNLFLNSFTPATQSITVTAQSYTTSLWGTGTATTSAGTATCSGFGAASLGVPNTISCTVGGTITVTVAGSPTTVNVEAGTFGTSPIPTTGAAATRPAEAIQFSLVWPTNFTVIGAYLQPVAASLSSSRVVNDGTTSTSPMFASTSVGSFNGTSTLATAAHGVAAGGVVMGGFAGSSASRAIVANGGTVVSDANTAGTLGGVTLGSNIGNSNFLNSYIRTVAIYPSVFSNSRLQAATAP